VCIGPITAEAVRQLGYVPAVVASDYTIPGLVEALLSLASKEGAHAR
jgi:uroporphyrinogen III methyltransferase/synthase